MERSSGLKECPRCGLRNRQGAYQCDFCGWDFKAASDDWIGQVNDLERIGREVEVPEIDTTTRSRIELTMKRPAEMPVAEKRVEARLDVPPHLTLDDHGDVLSQSTSEMMVASEPESVPETIDDAAPAAFPEASPATEASPEVPAVPIPVEEASSVPRHMVTNMPQFIPGGLLALGLGVYALDIYVISAGILAGGLAWGVSILASLLMVYAVIRFLPMVTRGKKKDGEEAVLCPVCHEMVSDNDSKCPSCGVRFREAPSRE
jgi:RNA polymerase subunit RPABC4/transcription elongation factor Spt4